MEMMMRKMIHDKAIFFNEIRCHGFKCELQHYAPLLICQVSLVNIYFPSGDVVIMQRLIDYITQYDSAYPSRIKGASEAEINELEVLVRDKLPDIYRSYLA